MTVVDANQNLITEETYLGGRYLGTQTPGGFNFAYTDAQGAFLGAGPRPAPPCDPLARARAVVPAAPALPRKVRKRSDGEADTNWPFGEFAAYQSGISPLHFTGKYHDTETNLDFFGARYYSSAQGRFLTPDWSADPYEPIPYADLADPQTLNLYAYTDNNPSTSTDPDGHNFTVCGVDGKHCKDVSDDQYEAWLKKENVSEDSNGNLYIVNPDGSDQKIGTAKYYDETQVALAGAIANEAGPPVNAMASGLNLIASIPFPVTTLAVDAASGAASSGPSEGIIPRLGTGEWGSNQRLNKLARDAAKAAGLDADQARHLHDVLEDEQLLAETAHRFTFEEIKRLALDIARGIR